MSNKNSEKRILRVGVVAYPVWKSLRIPLSNVMEVLCTFSDSVYLITDNGIIKANRETIRNQLSEINEPYKENASNWLVSIIQYSFLQIKILFYFMKLSKEINLYLLFMEDSAPLTTLLAKFLRKRIFWDLISNISEQFHYSNQHLFHSLALGLRRIIRNLPDKLILASPNLIEQWHLEKYQNKICIANEHFIDFENFKIQKNISERRTSIAYIGRLSEEKGTLNFVKAIPDILRQRNDINFLIGGDGSLRNEIEKYLDQKELRSKVELCGWVRHEDLANYLNDITLLVIPSYTESGPLIALEAMACGVVVLSSKVGIVPDIIKDGVTGFLMENNSIDCINENILRVLNCTNLEQVAMNGRSLVEKEFVFEKTVERYRRILNAV